MNKRLKGKVAFVTGAARGIGRACAERLAGEGANVALLDIVDAMNVAATIGSIGDAAYFRCDVGYKTEVDAAIEAVVNRFGQIDILVDNAGIMRRADFLDLSEVPGQTVYIDGGGSGLNYTMPIRTQQP